LSEPLLSQLPETLTTLDARKVLPFLLLPLLPWSDWGSEEPLEAVLPAELPVEVGPVLLLLPAALAVSVLAPVLVLPVLPALPLMPELLALPLPLMPALLALLLSMKSPLSFTFLPTFCESWLEMSEDAITSTDLLCFSARVNVSAPLAPLAKQPLMVLLPLVPLLLAVVDAPDDVP
jgi:hypothetical protein